MGQDHITRTLQNGISANRLAQAYLFVGPRGIGKTSTARILAKALNCVNGPTTTPCGECDACKEIADGRSLDVIEIDGASNNGVENIRDLRDNAAYAPARGPYKIYLIDEVHMLSTGAFNALLKTLEEPPPHVKFIFATTEAQKLPATITSRCQRFDLRRIPTELIAKHLTFIANSEKISLDPAAAEAIARGAEGGLRDAESMLDQMVAFCGEKIHVGDVMDVFGFTSKETVVGLAENLFARNAGGALGIVAEQSDAGKDLSRLTADLIAHLRDLLVSAATGQTAAVSQNKLLDLVDHFGEAAKPAAAPVLKTPEKPEPAPQPAITPKPADPEESGISAASAWEKIAASLAKDSLIRFGWLSEGVFERFEEGNLFVRFPASSKENSESMWMEKGLKDLESKLTKALSRTVRLVMEWEEAPARPDEPEFDSGPPPEESAPSAVATPAPPADPNEDFKNDPFIKKALEVFKSTLQTPSA